MKFALVKAATFSIKICLAAEDEIFFSPACRAVTF